MTRAKIMKLEQCADLSVVKKSVHHEIPLIEKRRKNVINLK